MSYRVLLISPGGRCPAAVTELFRDCDVDTVEARSSRDAMESCAYDIVLVNAHAFADAERTALDAAKSSAAVLMLVPECDYASARDKMTKFGVFVLPKPTTQATMSVAVDFLKTACERFRAEARRAGIVEEKIADMKLLNRAKWMLIDNLQMTEAEAHRYIERQAMDRCEPKRAVAESIINTYKTI